MFISSVVALSAEGEQYSQLQMFWGMRGDMVERCSEQVGGAMWDIQETASGGPIIANL